jgi:hypothetical protein
VPDLTYPERIIREREVVLLRADFPGWLVMWLDRTSEFRAYRMADTLTAPTAEGIAEKIRAARRR